jgi:hypothetical protein
MLKTGVQRFPKRSPSGCPKVEAGKLEISGAEVPEACVTESAGVAATVSGVTEIVCAGLLDG